MTFKVSAIATAITLLLGYPIAYRIVRTDSAAVRAGLIMLVAIPFMTNIIVRLYSLTLVLGNTGLINELAHAVGLIPERENIPLMRNQIGVTIGLGVFLPAVRGVHADQRPQPARRGPRGGGRRASAPTASPPSSG